MLEVRRPAHFTQVKRRDGVVHIRSIAGRRKGGIRWQRVPSKDDMQELEVVVSLQPTKKTMKEVSYLQRLLERYVNGEYLQLQKDRKERISKMEDKEFLTCKTDHLLESELRYIISQKHSFEMTFIKNLLKTVQQSSLSPSSSSSSSLPTFEIKEVRGPLADALKVIADTLNAVQEKKIPESCQISRECREMARDLFSGKFSDVYLRQLTSCILSRKILSDNILPYEKDMFWPAGNCSREQHQRDCHCILLRQEFSLECLQSGDLGFFPLDFLDTKGAPWNQNMVEFIDFYVKTSYHGIIRVSMESGLALPVFTGLDLAYTHSC